MNAFLAATTLARVGIVTDTANTARRRAIVVTLLRVEALVVFALGAFMVVEAFISTSEAPLALAGVVFFAFLGGTGLLMTARSFATHRNYGRAPAILANAIALGVAYYQAEAHLWIIAIPLFIVALTTFLLALSLTPARAD
ncbi:MAG: hypothetical protein H7227_06365 [Actinobacteria bacterium]|nr:hypothetical protein [Actinomycetota bacterium]